MRHTAAVKSSARIANMAQPTAAEPCAPTSMPATMPLTTMPAPGPANIKPPTAERPRAASCAKHQPVVWISVTALTTPAAKRRVGQAAGHGSAMPRVSNAVAASPARTVRGASKATGSHAKRAASQGCSVQSTAPTR